MAYLVLVRHGESEWTALGRWTGFADVNLTKQGRKEARHAAKHLSDIIFHSAHTSRLKRAQQTLHEIRKALKLAHIPIAEHEALNERNYGHLTGKNKWEIRKKHGDEQFKKWRRSWDHPVPGGESLKDVYNRVVPYFEQQILADLKKGKNIIVSAHGNSLRALVKHLEKIPNQKIPHFEFGIGEVHVYQINEQGRVTSKEIRVENPKKGKQ